MTDPRMAVSKRLTTLTGSLFSCFVVAPGHGQLTRKSRWNPPRRPSPDYCSPVLRGRGAVRGRQHLDLAPVSKTMRPKRAVFMLRGGPWAWVANSKMSGPRMAVSIGLRPDPAPIFMVRGSPKAWVANSKMSGPRMAVSMGLRPDPAPIFMVRGAQRHGRLVRK